MAVNVLLRQTQVLVNRGAAASSRFLPLALSQHSSSSRKFSRSFQLLKDKDKEEDMDELQKNPYYGKYADKIAKLQKTSPEEFLKRLAETEKAKKAEKSPAAEAKGRDFSLPTKPKAKADVKGGAIPSMIKEKKLDDVMKVDLLADKTKEEIAEIWRTHHSTKDSVCAVIPADMFKEMEARFQEFKTFLFPLPRKEGYEFVVVQFAGKEAHFTTLINFQAYNENAPECLTLVHYTDLADTKDIVLMVGEYDKNVMSKAEAEHLGVAVLQYYGQVGPDAAAKAKKLLLLERFTYRTDDFNHFDMIADYEDIQEAQCLANQVEMYYCRPTKEKLELLHNFNHNPPAFKHMDLIDQVNSANLLTEVSDVNKKKETS